MMANKKILLLEKDSRLWRFLFGWGRTVLAPGSGIPEKFLDITDLSLADSRAYEFSRKTFKDIIKDNDINTVNSLFQNEHSALIFRKSIGKALKKTFLSLIYLDKAKETFSLDQKILFVPDDDNFEVFLDVLKLNVQLTHFDIPKILKLFKRAKTFFMATFLRFVILIFSELSLLLSLFPRPIQTNKRDFKYAVYLRKTDPGITDKANSMDFLVKQGVANKNEILFILDDTSGLVEGSYLEKISSLGYESCMFRKVASSTGIYAYINKIYPVLRKMSNKIWGSGNRNPFILREYLSILKIARDWEAFYLKYNVCLFFGVQEPGAVARALWQKKHNSKYFFVYLSSNIMKYVAAKTYYSNIIADKLISSMIPITEFREQTNKIVEYCDVGVLNADIIRKIRKDMCRIKALRSSIDIKKDRQIIAVFDDNSDSYDTMPIDKVEIFLDILLRLLEEPGDFIYVYKPRAFSVFDRNKKIRELFEKVNTHKKCRIIKNSSVSALEMMAISDVVLTVPLSSSFTEALSAGLRTVCFVGENYMSESFNDGSKYADQIFASNYQGVSERIRNALNGWQKEFEDEFIERFVKKYIDRFSDGRAFFRLKECIVLEGKR